MEYTIDFESVEKKKLTKIFSNELKRNLTMLEDSCDYESFLETCVKNTTHILSIQEKLGKSKRAKDEYGFCIFCNDTIKHNEFKRTLPCNHEFHKKCIDKWLFKYYASFCPCCMNHI
jgi:hypothetical protein